MKKEIYKIWERFRNRKQRLQLLFLGVVITVIFCFLWLQNTKRLFRTYWKTGNYYDFNNITYQNIYEPKFDGEKFVHLDLKGAPPLVSYYKRLFPLLAKLGATGILMEYEDMFPYEGPLLTNISALNAYSLDDIQIIIKYAEKSHLTIIPLIQTFGHLEFILKLDDFASLREIPEYPQVICPTHNKTLDLIMEMVDQIVKAHPGITKLHIGADQVWFLGECNRCKQTMGRFGWGKNQLFLEHVSAVAHKIRNRYPHLRILMWDDKFRSISFHELATSYVSTLIEPVVWQYTKNVHASLGSNFWDIYATVFPNVWIASAFKGASGSNQYVTDIGFHFQNHRSWMSVISKYKRKINFQGIFITGWQRYDHFAVLCELLPVGIPSLAMSLRLLQGYNKSPANPLDDVATTLRCEQPHGLIGPTFGIPKCNFPGGSVLEIVLRFHKLNRDYERIIKESVVSGWMSKYNILHGFSNTYVVKKETASLLNLKTQLLQLEDDVFLAMMDVYDNYTIVEWIETYVKPLTSQVRKLSNAGEKLLSKIYWPRRPFKNFAYEL